jgi:hypothetical protein
MSTTLTCNKNLLSPVGFRLKVANYPNLEYFANAVTLPSLSLSEAASSYKSVNYAEPGDRINFDTLSIRFSVTEDMDNYLETYKWMHNIVNGEPSNNTDATLIILNSHNNKTREVTFKGIFPVSLSGLEFNVEGDIEYLTAEVTFKYSFFEIK